MLHLLINGYSLLVLIAVVLSWVRVSPDHPLRQVTDRTVEPVLDRIRRVLPNMGGIDFSPWVLLIGLRLLESLLHSGL